MILDPGMLNRRITIQSVGATQDESGQPSDATATVATTWANIRSATGKEVYAASGFVQSLSHVITLRYNAAFSVKPGMLIAYGTRTFRVQAVSDADEDKVQLQMLCLEML